MIAEILEALFLILTGLMAAYLIRHYIFTLTVLRDAGKKKKTEKLTSEPYSPRGSILVPAFNEENVIGRLLERICELTYPADKLQIIVVDDASTDATGKIAEGFTELHSQIAVLHRSKLEGKRGKASALNAGLKTVKGDIVLCFDADYCPQKNIVEQLVKEFRDTKVGAVQGRVIVLNEPENIVTRLVALERIGGYRIDQQARDRLGLIVQFGGTYGRWRCLPRNPPFSIMPMG